MTNSAVRLAMRVEGDFWCAYLAHTSTMEGALLLGSIRMSLVSVPDHRARKNAFMEMMQEALSDKLKAIGADTTEWNEPTAAPEHEKAGRA